MDKTKVKYFLIEKLIENSQYVTTKYCDFKDETIGSNPSPFTKAKKVVQFNWERWILRKKLSDDESSSGKFTHKEGFYPEYKAAEKQDNQKLFGKLKQYDVVSFDIFDTLIFRAVEKPEDVFRLLETEWGIIDFARIRRKTERELRNEKPELTIYDIYEKLSQSYGISAEDGVQKEIEIEKKVCHANPYMKFVVEKLLEMGKEIVLVSDMYIPKVWMKEILKASGYPIFQNIYVSCDCGMGKGSGELQKYVMEKMGQEKTYIHVGDNRAADIEGSKKAGWETVYYPNIKECGKKYRISGMGSIASSFYKGIVNEKLHSGMYKEDALYEYGFVYGGILVQGYCQFLDLIAKQENIDLFLFVARDGDIINKACEIREFQTDYQYIPFSRFASYQISMEQYMEQFINNTIITRVRFQKSTLESTLQEIDFTFLIDKLEENGLKKTEVLSGNNYEKFCDFVRKYKKDIVEHCKKSRKAAELYFKKIIGNHKKVCVVDIGWAGTGYFCLKKFLHDMDTSIEVCGALLGAKNSVSLCNEAALENMFYYLFGPDKNKNLLQKHFYGMDRSRYRCSVLEVMFSADQPSFLKFVLDKEGKVDFLYAKSEENTESISKIQRGILDFVKIYSEYEKSFGKIMTLPGNEAYEPIAKIMNDYIYCVELLGNYKFNAMSGIFEDDRSVTFREMMKQANIK